MRHVMVDVHSKFGNLKWKKTPNSMKSDPMMNNMAGGLRRTQLGGYISISQTGIQEPVEKLGAIDSFPSASHAKEESRHHHYSLVSWPAYLFLCVMKSSVRYTTLGSIKQLSIKFRGFFFFYLKGNWVVNWSTIK